MDLAWRLLTLVMYAAAMFGVFYVIRSVVYALPDGMTDILAPIVIASVLICAVAGLWIDRK